MLVEFLWLCNHKTMLVYYENTSGGSWWPKRGEDWLLNVKMLIGKLLTIHFQTWDLVEKWREISWVRASFWSVVCYHTCILNSYSKFKERETQFLSFSLFSITLFFEISFFFFSLPPSPSSLYPFFFFFFLFWSLLLSIYVF